MTDFERSRHRYQALLEYKKLQEKTDQEFDRISQTNRKEMRCFESCSQCCKSGLRIDLLEALLIAQNLKNNISLKKEVLSLEDLRENELKTERRCSFLNTQGKCSIYSFRPLICRAHGVPQKHYSQKGNFVFYRVCERNFRTYKNLIEEEREESQAFPSIDYSEIQNILKKLSLGTKSIELKPSAVLELGDVENGNLDKRSPLY